MNAVKKRDIYPIPGMDDCLDSIEDRQIFTTLDANYGYKQVAIDDKAKPLPTFTTQEGLPVHVDALWANEFTLAKFQRAMDIILSRVKWSLA